MAKKATKTATSKTGGRKKAGAKGAAKSKAVTSRRSSGRGRRTSDSAGDAFIKLLQSPLVAELVAVAATAALASLAEEGFGNRGTSGGKRAGRAVKHAGKAAANAIGRRLSTEIDEIKKAAKAKKA